MLSTNNYEDDLQDEFLLDPNYQENRINYLIELERLSINLLDLNKIILTKESKKDKFKDLMNQLKEGKVQKDLTFNHYFEDNLFLNLSRKDSVDLTEKMIGRLIKELIEDKKKFEEIKIKLIKLIIDNINNVRSDIIDVDDEILNFIEKDYFKILNKK